MAGTKERTARRIAHARVAAADEASAAPLRHADRAGIYKPREDPVGFPLPSVDLPTMRDLMELSRATTRDNIRKLVEIRDSNAAPAVRLGAISMLLDRGYGRAHQSIAVADLTDKGSLDMSGFSEDELRTFETLLTRAAVPGSKPRPAESSPLLDVTPAKPRDPDPFS